MTSTMGYTEAQIGHNTDNNMSIADLTTDHHHYHTDGDDVSTTLTFQTGASSGYQPNRISLSRLSRLSRHSIKIKSSSSFPNLLSLYQTPIREESNIEKLEQKPKRPKREKKRKEVKKQDWEEHHESRTKNEQRAQRVDAVAREQLDKFDSYMVTMKQKVDKQREERQKYNEILQERLKSQEEVEKRKLRLHRGPRHVYVHDTSYRKALPVSKYCKATRLADELKRKGVLRTRGDVDRYWNGFGGNQRKGVDIFAADSDTSVNYPNQWMSTLQNPDIRIHNEDDNSSSTTAHQHPTQLPPLKLHKLKQKKTVAVNDD